MHPVAGAQPMTIPQNCLKRTPPATNVTAEGRGFVDSRLRHVIIT
jgi:hypothetical protein